MMTYSPTIGAHPDLQAQMDDAYTAWDHHRARCLECLNGNRCHVGTDLHGKMRDTERRFVSAEKHDADRSVTGAPMRSRV